MPTDKKRAGDPKSQSTRVVCALCNSGWMSRLQEDAKPDILALVLGNPATLGVQKQRRLAAWCAMSAMTAEFLAKSHEAVIPFSERAYLKAKLHPPKRNWKIWIGRCAPGMWDGNLMQNSMPIVEEEPEIGPNGFPLATTQTTTWGVGQLYIHAFSSIFPDLIRDIRFKPNVARYITQIWPVESPLVRWPPAFTLTEAAAEAIANGIARDFDHAARRILGFPPRET